MRLRSKFTLLLLVGAVLLAAPAMALIADRSGNILPAFWTSHSEKADTADPSTNPHGNSRANTSPAPAIQGDQSDIANPSASTLPVQTIRSNKAEYAPGARVTLNGSNWQPGESVRIDVNDDRGKLWSRRVDVRADASGRIEDQFQLPERFVATYEVFAMGAQSGVATTSFTEGNVSNVSFGSTDNSGTNRNTTDLIARFESAKHAPEARPQPIVSTEEDTARTITLIRTTDEGGDNLSFIIVTAPNHGTLDPIGDLTCAGTAPRICSANVTYTPEEDYNGFDFFSYKASEGTEASFPAPVSILVNPVNDTPVATDETRTMSEDGGPISIDFGALLSDVETSDANLTYDITNPPDPAKGSLDGTGSTRNFTPAANFNGTVDIGYTLTDRGDPDKCSAANPPCAAARISAQKSVSVTVDAVNDAPSFTRGPDQRRSEDSGAQTVEGWATAISSGPKESGQTVDFNLTNDNNDLFASGGQPSVGPNGTLTYTPADNVNGSATVSVKLHDDGDTANGEVNQSAEQSFTINVNAVNDAPGFQKGADQRVNEDAGAQTVDGWATSISAGPNESNQTVDFQLTNTNNDLFSVQPSVAANGTLSYTPAPNAQGNATVKVKAHDDGGTANGGQDESAEQTFTINIGAVNDAPSFTKGDNQKVNEDSGAHSVPNWAKAISAGPANENGQRMTFEVTNDNNDLFASGGQPSVGPNGTLTYTPADNVNGSATVSVKLHDDGDTANGEVNQSAEQSFTINVTAVNDAPVAHADGKTTDEDTKLVFPSSDLVSNDDEGADNESSQALSIAEVYEGARGTVSLGNDGNITFTPEPNFSGGATFTYLVCDNGSPSRCSLQRAAVNVTVSPVNDAPVADDQSVTTDEDTAKEVALSASDVEGDALGYTIVRAPRNGTLSGTGANLTYTPDADFNGPDSFTFKASDGTADSDPATASIAVGAVNDAPVANDDTTSTNEDTPLVIPARQLLGNDDPGPANEGGQTLTLTAVGQALNGQVSLGANGDITFTPAPDFNGQASFVYTVCDNGSPSECSGTIAIVDVAMGSVNDAPGFTAGPNQTVAEDSGAHGVPGWATGISAGSADESGQALTFRLSNTNTSLFSAQPEVTPKGKLTYTPAANASGSAEVSVRLEDNGGTANGGADESAEQTFTIDVTAVNDAPMVSNLQGDSAANEGDVKTYTFDIADVDSSSFSAWVDCGGTGKGKLVAESLRMGATDGEFKCEFLDGLSFPTPVNISVQLSDFERLSNVESGSVSVSNVAPALTGLSSSSQNALAGTPNPVTFAPTATDASPRDLGAGFGWRWTIDGGAYAPAGGANRLYFSTCGTHAVKAQASDKDGGLSAASPEATKSVSVYDAAFGPPLVDGSTNMVQKGQIVPVKISIGCGTTTLTNLAPHIQLLGANVSPETETGSTTVTTNPVLAADITQTMRPVEGGYVYNLRVPSNAAAGTEYTVLVNPFGTAADDAATGMYLVMKISK